MPYETIHEASQALRKGEVTALELVEDCLAQVEAWEPFVHAWVLIESDRARDQAAFLGNEMTQGRYRGPLHGIPLAIKDIFDVADWPTAAGSKRWAQSIARQDAEVVRRLRSAGAILLGKTVTTQFASFDPPVTCNPWNLGHTPGGSSSGSAAAVSTRMCLGALGSQTGGSITRPASYCGVAGCKPTYGAVPVDGVVPLAYSMDHPGPIARCVRDLALILEVIWPAGPALLATRPVEPVLGRIRGLFEEHAEPSVITAIDEVATQLRAQGATIREMTLPASFRDILLQHRIVMAVEAGQFHRARLQQHPEDYAPRILSLIEEGFGYSAADYADARAQQVRLGIEMAELFRQVPVLLTPATTSPAPPADTTGNPAFNSPWSFTGLPTVSFPTGQLVQGLPLAIQLVGPAHGEVELFAQALWCEQALGARPLNPPVIA